MKILSIDTCSPICAVAILEDSFCLKEISLNNGLTHSESLMPIINQALTETNLNLEDIDLFVCDIGPRLFYRYTYWCCNYKSFCRCFKQNIDRN